MQLQALERRAAERHMTLSTYIRAALSALQSNDPEAAIVIIEDALGLAHGASRAEVMAAVDAIFATIGDPGANSSAPLNETGDAPATLSKGFQMPTLSENLRKRQAAVAEANAMGAKIAAAFAAKTEQARRDRFRAPQSAIEKIAANPPPPHTTTSDHNARARQK